MKLQCLKLFIMTKQKKNEFLEDFREISLVGSLKSTKNIKLKKFKDYWFNYRNALFNLRITILNRVDGCHFGIQHNYVKQFNCS